MRAPSRPLYLILLFWTFFCARLHAVDSFRVATYNVENYLETRSGTRPAKSDAAKAKVLESILALKPDVLALQEMGTTNMLLALQATLKTNDLDLPHWEYVTGFDTNIHIAILSRFPITVRHPHTNDAYILNGHELAVSRGFAEVEIQPATNYTFTLIVAHLKSKRPVEFANETDMRLAEAKLLREKIDTFLAANPAGNLIVLGDFNDLPDSPAIKLIIGRGKKALFDTRPAEMEREIAGRKDRRLAERTVAWTHFYSKDDTYSRIDYILLNHNLTNSWVAEKSKVLDLPGWGVASDHRPLAVTLSPK